MGRIPSRRHRTVKVCETKRAKGNCYDLRSTAQRIVRAIENQTGIVVEAYMCSVCFNGISANLME